MKQHAYRRTSLRALISKRITWSDFGYGCLAVTLFTLVGVILGKGF